MSGAFDLVPLDCAACGAALAAEPDDAVFYCTACHSGFRFDPGARRGLAPVEVAFVADPRRSAEGHLPFWSLPARVELTVREASGGAVRKLIRFFGGGESADATDVTFVLPAFRLPIADAVQVALRYTRELPALDQLLGERLTGGVHDVDDAVKMAHYVLVASEVRKPDTLKELDYRLTPGTPGLLGVPWVRRGDERVDAVFGLPLGLVPATGRRGLE